MVIQSIFKVIIFKKVVSLIKCIDWLPLRKNRPNTEFFLVHIFPHSNWIWRDTPYLSVFSPNSRKYGPEKTSYLDTFLAVCFTNYLNVNELFTLLLVLFKRANYLLRSGHPLSKRCPENMQQIHRRAPMPKYDFNKVALQLFWNHTSTWVLSYKFGTYFQNTFFKENLWVAASACFSYHIWYFIQTNKNRRMESVVL